MYVLLCETYALVDFARILQNRGLLDTGNYVIISFQEEEVYNPNKKKQYFIRDFEAPTDDDNKEDNSSLLSFRAVLMITPSAPIDPDYDEFTARVNNRSRSPPFNIPFHPYISIQVNLMSNHLNI